MAETSGKGLQDETAWVPVPVLPQMSRVNLRKLTSLRLSTLLFKNISNNCLSYLK